MWGSTITDHAMQENRLIDWESARIIGKERDDKARGIKEAVHVRILPNMNYLSLSLVLLHTPICVADWGRGGGEKVPFSCHSSLHSSLICLAVVL